MSTFLDLVRQRQSVRAYLPDPVPEEVLERCLEAARLAPSACNSQPWRFIVVDDPALRDAIADETSDRLLPLNHFTKQAPVHVLIVVEPPKMAARVGAWVSGRDFPWMDVGIAAEHFCLQAAAEGVGTCMLGWFHEREIKRLLRVPATRSVALVITLGYPADTTVSDKQRKPMPKLVCRNGYA